MESARSIIIKRASLALNGSQSADDWRNQYYESRDLFKFVRQAAPAALRGDGAAALYIFKALQICLLETALYGRSPNPSQAFSAWQATQVYATPADAAIQREHFHACTGFFKGNAFASLPPRMGGYGSPKFWLDLAYKYNDPVAAVYHVIAAMPVLGNASGSADANVVQTAQADLNRAVSSGNAEAIFRAGLFLSNDHGETPTQGAALEIAACNLGYNCSASNGSLFGNCAANGTCQAGLSFLDQLEKALGPAAYARVYTQAQTFENALAQGDTSIILQFTQLKATK